MNNRDKKRSAHEFEMIPPLDYPDEVIPSFRFQFCPMCKTRLIRQILFDDNIPLVTCPSCHWICSRSNLTAVVSVVTCPGGIITILPPALPPETPAALPAGMIEYGESPEEASIRETREETGFETKVVTSLGWFFLKNFSSWPGPLTYFMFEACVIGGAIKESAEGKVKVYPLEAFPEVISPKRGGSWQAINAYLTRLNRQSP